MGKDLYFWTYFQNLAFLNSSSISTNHHSIAVHWKPTGTSWGRQAILLELHLLRLLKQQGPNTEHVMHFGIWSCNVAQRPLWAWSIPSYTLQDCARHRGHTRWGIKFKINKQVNNKYKTQFSRIKTVNNLQNIGSMKKTYTAEPIIKAA